MAEAEGRPPTQASVTQQPGRGIVVDTPVAKPMGKREVVTRRLFLLGGFWSALGLALVGMIGSPLDFIWPRNLKGFGGPITVGPDRVPAEGEEPVRIVEGKFWLLNLKAGPTTAPGAETSGGLLALWTKCPHLGCTIPWRPDFTYERVKAWFRCPCHGSTYSRDGGVKVFGPAPRSMDVFPITVNSDRSLTVLTGRAYEGSGSNENPSRAVAYEPGNETPEKA